MREKQEQVEALARWMECDLKGPEERSVKERSAASTIMR
jgi:hypothetical protein